MSYMLEVWNVTNTQRLAVVGPLLDEGAIEWRLAGDEIMECRAAVNDPDAAHLLVDGAVLRLQRPGVAADFSLWRLVEREFADDGRVVAVGAYALWMDLAQGRLGQEMVGGRVLYEFGLLGLTPLRWLSDLILPACRSQALTFAAGVVEATTPVESLSFTRGTSPLAGLRALEAATRYEVQTRYSADGRTCFVDLLARLGRTKGAAIHTAKNVAAITMREDLRVATRIMAFGAGQLSLADATWTVATATGPAGARVITFSGMHPVFEDGAFTGVSGPMWFYVPGKGAYPITASAKAAGTLTLNDSGAVVPGDVGYIAITAAGKRLDYLESPSAVAKYGVQFGEDLVADDIPDASNIIPNADLTGVYSGGLPPGWAKVGTPTTTESTDLRFASVGGQAVRVQATAADQGVRSPAGVVGADPLKPYHGALAGVVLISGQVRMIFRHSNGTAYPIDAQVVGSGLNIPFELKREPLHVQPLPTGTGQVDVVSHGGPAEFYLNYVMVSPQVGAEVQPFVAGQAAHVLWSRAAEKLAEDSKPKREVNANVVDLFAIDPGAFPYDEIGRGDTLPLRAVGFPDLDLRAVQMTTPIWGSTRPLAITLAENARSRPAGEADAYLPEYGPSRPGAAPSPPQATVVALTLVQADFDPAVGQVYIRAAGNALTSTLQLFTKTSRTAAWPQAPTATINGRQGTFPGVSVPSGQVVFYRVVALDSTGAVGDTRDDVYSRVAGSPPVLSPRRAMNTARTAADVTIGFETPSGERVLLRVKDSEAANAQVWVAVAVDGSGNPTNVPAEFIPGVTEALPTQWFRDGGGTGPNAARKLQNLPLARDQVSRIHVQGEGRDSALRSDWIPVLLEAREQPWLESLDLVWDEAAGKLRASAVAGAFTVSVRFEIDDDPAMGSPLALDQAGYQSCADGARVEVSATVPAADRGRVFHLRVTPFNGPVVAGVSTGTQGVAQRDTADVPASEAGVRPPWARIDTSFANPSTTLHERFTITGGVGAGGATPIRWRTKITSLRNNTVATSGWTTVAGNSFNAEISVQRDLRWARSVVLEVEDAAGRLTASSPAHVDAVQEAMGEDGRVNPNTPYAGGGTRRPADTDDDALAGRRADNDWATAAGSGYVDRTSGRVLRVRDGDTGQDVTGGVLADGSRRARTGLNGSGRLTTGVERSADLAGIPSALVSRAAAAVYGEHFETFDPAAWIARSGTPQTTFVLSAGTGQTGGNSLRVQGYLWLVPDVAIPFDPSKVYRVRVRARRMGDGVTANVFFGLEGIASDKTTLINTNGANTWSDQHYFAAANEEIPAGTEYTTYTGFVRGLGTAAGGLRADPASPGVMRTGVAYIRPVIIVNYLTGTETIHIDEILIDSHDEELAARAYGAISGGGSLKSHVAKLNNGRGYPVGTVLGTAALTHGATIEFIPALDRPVRLCYAGGGRPYVAAWAGVDQCTDLGIDNATSSGGTLRALVRQISGALVSRTLVPTSGVASNPYGQAYNDRYDFRFSVTLPSRPGRDEMEGSSVRIGFYTRLPSGVWTKNDERSYDNYTGNAITINGSVEVARDGLGAGAEFKIVTEYVYSDPPVPPNPTLQEVRFMEGTAAASTSLTPAGAEPVIVQFIAD